MVRDYFRNWNVVRLLRLAMGIWIVVEGARSGLWPIIVMGLFLALMPVLNAGCCTSGSCSLRRDKRQRHNQRDEVDFEEL